jgi:hypothetical protein
MGRVSKRNGIPRFNGEMYGGQQPGALGGKFLN